MFYVVRRYTKLLKPNTGDIYAELPGRNGRRVALRSKPDGSGWEKEDIGPDKSGTKNPNNPYFIIPGFGAIDEHEMRDLVQMFRERSESGDMIGSDIKPRPAKWWLEELYKQRQEKYLELQRRSQFGYGQPVVRSS